MTTFGSRWTQVDGQGTPPFNGNALHCLPTGSMDGRHATHGSTPGQCQYPSGTGTWNLPVGLLEGTSKTRGV